MLRETDSILLPKENRKKVKVLVAQLCPTFCNPMDCSLLWAPLSMEFSRQEHLSG